MADQQYDVVVHRTFEEVWSVFAACPQAAAAKIQRARPDEHPARDTGWRVDAYQIDCTVQSATRTRTACDQCQGTGRLRYALGVDGPVTVDSCCHCGGTGTCPFPELPCCGAASAGLAPDDPATDVFHEPPATGRKSEARDGTF